MARYTTTVQSNRSREEVFDYLANFANASEWDPGVVSAENLTGQPIGAGSQFRLMCRFSGRQFPLVYRITAFETPSRVVFEADQGNISSVDEIRFVARDEGTSVTYEASLRVTGPLGRLVDPLLAIAFRRIGGRAEVGLRRELNVYRAQ
jgi:carbon monoxide dehydrogenase subunit G